MGFQQVEADADIRCEQVVAEAKRLIQLYSEEKDKALLELSTAKSELALTTQYKSQVPQMNNSWYNIVTLCGVGRRVRVSGRCVKKRSHETA
jgi:hypothetical protein